MDYYKKYYKYKSKYLNLQYGSGNIDILIFTNPIKNPDDYIINLPDIKIIRDTYFKDSTYNIDKSHNIDKFIYSGQKYDIIIAYDSILEKNINNISITSYLQMLKPNGIFYINNIVNVKSIQALFESKGFKLIIPIQYKIEGNYITYKYGLKYTWQQKLDSWARGDYFKYPQDLMDDDGFFYRTSELTNSPNCMYDELYVKTDHFNQLRQDYNNFQEHIDKSPNKYVISFLNSGKDAKLIIPMPYKNSDGSEKNYVSLKHFCDNAPEDQQREFWKYAAIIIREYLIGKKVLYINTSGTGVPYLHLRLDTKPKYYGEPSERLLNIT